MRRPLALAATGLAALAGALVADAAGGPSPRPEDARRLGALERP